MKALMFLAAGIAAGAASAFYLAYNYHDLLLHGTIHAAIFSSGLVAMYFTKSLSAASSKWYLAGALPVHLAIHFFVIGDLAQLTGVSHSLLSLLCFP